MTPKQKKFAALAKPRNKITYADKIAGATKAKRGKTKMTKADKGKAVISDRLKSLQKQTSMKMRSPRIKALSAQTRLGRRKK